MEGPEATKKSRERALSPGTGGMPAGGWATLVPELSVSDLAVSLKFWCELLGFTVAFDRPAAKFAYLDLQGAQIMLCQHNGHWQTAALEKPLGRGINLQIAIRDIEPALRALAAANWPLYDGPRESWYRVGDQESGQREFLVQDPDGYLVRLAQELGERPAS